jgi:hypothetical protein
MKIPQRNRWLKCLALTLFASAFITGCQKMAKPEPALELLHEIAPQPPKVGPATITLSLADAAGKPVAGARVNLEGNMSHPGMNPVFAEAREIGSGRYQASIEFTMGGDWIMLVRINLPDGHKVEREFEVKGVRAG